MKKFAFKIALLCVLLAPNTSLLAQTTLHDSFSDSLFSKSIWHGNWPYFSFSNNGLKSNCSMANTNFGLVTNIHFDSSSTVEWQFEVAMNFETSSANYIDLLLLNDSISKTKYVVRLGNTKDEVALYYMDGVGKTTLLADGDDQFTANSVLMIKALYDGSTLHIQYKKTNADTFKSLLPIVIQTPSKFYKTGFSIQQSTASFFKKHEIKSIYFGPEIKDVTAPIVTHFSVKSAKELDLGFSEKLIQKNCAISFRAKKLVPAAVVWHSDTSLTIAFNEIFDGDNLDLHLSTFCDATGNCMPDTIVYFSFHPPKPAEKYDVLITEIMPDPDPVVGLPNYEYVELYNNTKLPINLQGWTISDPTKTSVLGSYTVGPNAYLIVCDVKAVAEFQAFGNTLGVSGLPSLNNGGDSVWLQSPDLQVIHHINYTPESFGTSWKKYGGWSLEMMDVSQPCLQHNWSISDDSNGGSPGKVNSVNQHITDNNPPQVVQVTLKSPTQVNICFSKILPEQVLPTVVMSDGFEAIVKKTPVMNCIEIHLTIPLEKSEIYQFYLSGVQDCIGNLLPDTLMQIGIPDVIEFNDVLLNEILFNPMSGGDDFIEIINNSTKILDISTLYFSRKDSAGNWEQLFPLCITSQLIFPNEIMAFTTNIETLIKIYPKAKVSRVLTCKSLPSLPDNIGNIGLALFNGNEIDFMVYDKNQHSTSIAKTEGVSLERLSLRKGAMDASNWTSASYTQDYATPGYQNSMRILPITSKGKLTIQPDPLSPNGDAHNDVLQIQSDLQTNSALYHIRIFDLLGNLISFPINAAHASGKETFFWDGSTYNGETITPGIYLVVCEIMLDDGTQQIFKTPITIIW